MEFVRGKRERKGEPAGGRESGGGVRETERMEEGFAVDTKRKELVGVSSERG